MGINADSATLYTGTTNYTGNTAPASKTSAASNAPTASEVQNYVDSQSSLISQQQADLKELQTLKDKAGKNKSGGVFGAIGNAFEEGWHGLFGGSDHGTDGLSDEERAKVKTLMSRILENEHKIDPRMRNADGSARDKSEMYGLIQEQGMLTPDELKKINQGSASDDGSNAQDAGVLAAAKNAGLGDHTGLNALAATFALPTFGFSLLGAKSNPDSDWANNYGDALKQLQSARLQAVGGAHKAPAGSATQMADGTYQMVDDQGSTVIFAPGIGRKLNPDERVVGGNVVNIKTGVSAGPAAQAATSSGDQGQVPRGDGYDDSNSAGGTDLGNVQVGADTQVISESQFKSASPAQQEKYQQMYDSGQLLVAKDDYVDQLKKQVQQGQYGSTV